MKKLFRKGTTCVILGLALAGSLVTSCGSDDDTTLGNWVTSTVFDGAPRSSAFVFTIDNYGYAGTGYDGDDYLNDFWRYNISGGYWEQLADFPGAARSSATSFAIGANGYVGTGYDGINYLKDFYKYDTAAGSWTAISEYPGTARRGAIGFSSTSNGYVGTGYDTTGDKKDFFKYDPVADSWTELYGFGGNKRHNGSTFTIGTQVYLGLGSSNDINQKDFWVFDTGSESWTRLRDLDYKDSYAISRTNATAFAMGSYGYVCGGDKTSTWEYDPSTDLWKQKTQFEGASRQDAIAIYNGTQAFVALGKYGNSYYDDMWEFKPFDAKDLDD
ncbi:Kelch repeat-containing protein [Flavobacterium sp. RHBU_3]|uniref:Kelch repeat-containing protein n=1 Tax=Flavobacterium sp. RHBU_3 TaxID=3391184 RepID=UPI0039851531